MGRSILKRKAQEDGENSLHELVAKRKQKNFKLKGLTKEDKSPVQVKKNTIVRQAKRMALVDNTNKSSHPRDPIVSKDGRSETVDDLNMNKLPVKMHPAEVVIPVKDAVAPPSSSTCIEKNSEGLKENCAPPRYKVSPIERPVTRSRKVPPSQRQEPSKGSETSKRKGTTKRKREHDGKGSQNKASPGEGATPAREIHKSLAVPSRGSVLAERANQITSTNRRNGAGAGSSSARIVLKSKDLDGNCVVKRKQADVRKKDDELTAVDDHHSKETAPGTEPTKDLCVYCRKIKVTCSCHIVVQTPLSSYSAWLRLDASRQLERIEEVLEKKSSPPLDSAPSSSHTSGVETPSKKPVKLASGTTEASPKVEPTLSCSRSPGVDTSFKTPKKQPSSSTKSPKVPALSLFSCFKKPETLHRNLGENKIFVSASKEPSKNLRNRTPVYPNKNMTKRGTSLARKLKEFEFEVDENEPKPKKKQRRIMKIQRIRAHKPKKPNVYVSDPVTEMRLLRNLDLSPSVLKQVKVNRLEEINKPESNQPSTSTRGVEVSLPSSNPHTVSFADGKVSKPESNQPSTSLGVGVTVPSSHHHTVNFVEERKVNKPESNQPSTSKQGVGVTLPSSNPHTVNFAQDGKVSKPEFNQPSTSQGVGVTVPSSNLHAVNFAQDGNAPSSDVGIYDMDVDHHEDYNPCASSPCSKYGSSTPLHAYDNIRHSLLDESIHRFGGHSAKLYSPVKSKASPIPVLLENFNNDPIRLGDSDQRSASNVSVVSSSASYDRDLNISSSTPVKFHKHDSTPVIVKYVKPKELNISNCFGFDEPEVAEEPLVSPIKTAICVTPPPATPARAGPVIRKRLIKAPPPEPASVDVEEVIRQLRSEVGENEAESTSMAKLPLFKGPVVSPVKKSPMKHYLESKANATPEKSVEDKGTPADPEVTMTKIPKLSYERPKKKVVIVEPSDSDDSESDHSDAPADETEDSDSDIEETEPMNGGEMPFEIPAHEITKKHKASPRKKGMTRKEKRELEKWAKMFNSQCEQVSKFGLCLE